MRQGDPQVRTRALQLFAHILQNGGQIGQLAECFRFPHAATSRVAQFAPCFYTIGMRAPSVSGPCNDLILPVKVSKWGVTEATRGSSLTFDRRCPCQPVSCRLMLLRTRSSLGDMESVLDLPNLSRRAPEPSVRAQTKTRNAHKARLELKSYKTGSETRQHVAIARKLKSTMRAKAGHTATRCAELHFVTTRGWLVSHATLEFERSRDLEN